MWSVGEHGILVAVSDGLGGHAAGEVASAISVDALFEGATKEAAPGLDEEARLRGIVSWASRHVRKVGERIDRRGMGATLTAIFFHRAGSYVAQIGDSRAYRIRDGEITQLTRDQSYVQALVDRGMLTPEEAEHSPQKNLVMQVMGQSKDVSAAVEKLEIEPGDRYLLCSDGLSNSINDDEILRFASEPATPDQACDALIAKANEAGGRDNITVVLAAIDR